MGWRGDTLWRRVLPILAAVSVLGGIVPAAAVELTPPPRDQTALQLRIEKLAEKQRELLGIPEGFFPFLEDDARVRTGRYMWADPVPDLVGNSHPEVLETDVRYRYSVANQQGLSRVVESEVNTRITVRSGRDGQKLWRKKYNRDAYPFSMRVGRDGRHGVVVISGLWNFYGTTEQSTLRFDAFSRTGKLLWRREFQSISYYDFLTYVTEDAPIVIASFNGVRGRAEDLLVGLATMASAVVTNTTATRTVVLDGRDGSQNAHPIVDIGVDWWPIPLPVRDLDGDGLDDYATTNKFGIDPGNSESQEGPSIGGTVYTRKGTDGTPIWTTSGLEMDIWAWPEGLPDVASDETPDISVSTYVARNAPAPIPIDVPLLGYTYYKPRVYLLDGYMGAELWHKPSEWIYTPGDIDGRGKPDLMLGTYRVKFRKNKTILTQTAVNGYGHRLWQRVSTWHYETMPCPRDLCFGGAWGWLDWSPDYDPDRVRDSLLSQEVQQNGAFGDKNTRAFDGRTGRLRFEDKSDARIQTVGVAVDGRGTDLMAVEYRNLENEVRISARDGSNRMLWTGLLGGPDNLTPRRSGFYALGLKLRGDRCGDLLINGWEREHSFYGVFDGGTGRMLWSRWTGLPGDRPRITERLDRNQAC